MNLADAAQLILTMSLKDEVSSGLKAIQGELDKTNTKGATLQGGLTKIGQGLGVGIRNTAKIGAVGFAALWSQVDAGIDSLVELEDVANQTEAVIKSTGGAAGLTADDIRDLAVRMEDLSGVDDKVIQSGENVLLTFTNIREDAFEPATLAALNMSQAMGTDLQSSIVQVGKALNDPIAGITALTRVGVTFSAEQKAVIQSLVDTGDVAGAQQVILEELNKEFGGSAQASMEGYRGTQLRLKDTWEDLQQTLATALLPALDKLGKKLKENLADPEVKEGIRKLGEGIAGLFSDENIKSGSDALKSLFTFLKELPWENIKSGMAFAAENAKKVVDVFRSLPPGVQAGLLTFLAANKLTGGLVATGIGELLKVGLSSLKTITATSVTVVGPVSGGPGSGGAGNLASAVLPVTIAGIGAVAIDQYVQGQAAAVRQVITDHPMDAGTVELLQSSGFVNILAQGNDPLGQFLGGFLGPGFVDINRQLGDWADSSYGFDVRAAASADITRILLGQIHMAQAAANALTQVNNGMTADQRAELQRMNNNTMPGIRDALGVGNQKTDEQNAELDRIRNFVSVASSNLGIQLGQSREQNAELDRIQNATALFAKKDVNVDVSVKTTFQVSAREIAAQIMRVTDIANNPWR